MWKYSEFARLGPTRTTDPEISADEFMNDFNKVARDNYRGRLYCIRCNSKMIFIAKGKRKSHFKHYPGTGEDCKNVISIHPNKKRTFKKLKIIVSERKSFRIIGHMRDAFGNPLPEPNGNNSQSGINVPPRPPVATPPIRIGKSKYDLSIEEILELQIKGADLSDKTFLFYGKFRKFDDIFIDVHSLNYQRQRRLQNNEPKIYWGDFYRICCEKGGKNVICASLT